MSQRPSRTRPYQQEPISEGDEEGECPEDEYNQRNYPTETNRQSVNTAGGRSNERRYRSTTVEYSPENGRPYGASSYQEEGVCLPEERSNSRSERYYQQSHSPGRRPPYQSFEGSEYQPTQYSSTGGRPVSPRHASYPDHNSRSFREQRAEDMEECEERPSPRAVAPPYRQLMSARENQYASIPSSPYAARYRSECDDSAVNPTMPSAFRESTTYPEIAPYSPSGRDQSGSRNIPEIVEPQSFNMDTTETEYYAPTGFQQQNYSPDNLDVQNYPSDRPENFTLNSPDPRNTSGGSRPGVSPDYLEVPHNSPAMKHYYSHASSLRTPQPGEGDANEECALAGGTYRKSGPEYLGMNTGGNSFPATPSPGAASAMSYGKFGLTSGSQKSWGASPPISSVGGASSDNKRDALEHLSQLTVTKSNKPSSAGCSREGNREVQIAQQTVTKPNKSCVTPNESGREASDECPPRTKSIPARCKRALDFGQGIDFSSCDTQAGGALRRTLPKKPELSQDEIKEMIDSENEDVGCAWLLSSEQKQTYKKPCPKQQKAQMSVKHMVETAQKPKGDPCVKEYPPLLEPEPEDLSPEVAAAMMFSQEQGIKLDSCPDQTIKHLFSRENLQKKPPPSKISIVDPNQKDQEELIEKSASVPSEGVSDSAYTRTMKQKGGDEIPSQKSYDLDFALGQEKREVVLVPQRPKRFNTVQFRGNLTPWFPGYFSAFPDQSDGIKVVSSPSKLFLKAWIMTNPANVPAGDIIVIE